VGYAKPNSGGMPEVGTAHRVGRYLLAGFLKKEASHLGGLVVVLHNPTRIEYETSRTK
jgi:hypothetical protein